ncbi:PREDICTED: uncharacterized protein LOC109184577 [Ipomoea nil]|uniref:uncharacterized protein LOC109184577 n=1 Tax=Ipomoea nil TaxID=35883 RepID=UPI00090122B9|nr:PREDICTED: uncharacterized protein LOC109184577 [Ipomoea nil]
MQLMIWLSLALACSDVYPPPKISRTLLSTANGTMCLDGSPSAYFFDEGEGEGVDNWLIFFEISYNLSPVHVTCLLGKNCTLAEMASIIEALRLGLIHALPMSDPSFRGIWVTNCITHDITVFSWIAALPLRIYGNKTYPQVFADWFYDRSAVQIIDQSTEGKNCSDYSIVIKKKWT